MFGDEILPAIPAPPRGPRKRYYWMACGLAILLLGLVTCSLTASLYHPCQLPREELVNVTRATSFNFLCKRLYARRMISNQFAFKVYGHVTRQAGKLKAGAYRITSGMRPVDILAMLTSGLATRNEVTVPEGKWAEEIPGYLQSNWPDAAEAFPAMIMDMAHWRRLTPFPLSGTSLEGYLFPDTYQFATDATADEIVRTMLTRFRQTCWAAYQADPPKDGRSLYQVLILASLVEAEAKRDNERATIAGVYLNRLHENPPDFLACDATLLYAEHARKTRVLDRDKLVMSPYNTYKLRGLPPGPINNPGLKSFRAALHPARHDYFYYVARGDGSHMFAHTAGEQAANIRLIRGK
jgi:UPF0755 protein